MSFTSIPGLESIPYTFHQYSYLAVGKEIRLQAYDPTLAAQTLVYRR